MDDVYYKLASKGAKTWNCWARTNISEEEINELPISNERRLEFKNINPLTDVEQKKLANELGVLNLSSLNDKIVFQSEIDYESFGGYFFLSDTSFENCTFREGASFNNAIFFKEAIFSNTTFLKSANFRNVVFNQSAIFAHSKFHKTASFSGVRVKGGTNFQFSKFYGWTHFSNSSLQLALFIEVEFKGMSFFDNTKFISNSIFQGAIFFKEVFFKNSTFYKSVDFANTEFKSMTSFSDVSFNEPPIFHEAKFHQDTSFYNAKYKSVSGGDTEVMAWRTLKIIMNKLHNHDLELLYFSLEMDAKIATSMLDKNKLKALWKAAPLYTYKTVSNYGNSIALPVIWIFILIVFFAMAYDQVSWISSHEDSFYSFKLSLSNFLPFVPTSKAIIESILEGQNVSIYLQALMVLQNILSAGMLFLLGLGLRNLFSIK